MRPSFHCDTGTILSHEYTTDGFLRVYGRVAKVGDLVYRDGNSTRTEYVSSDVLFAKDSIDSLKMVPLTLDHPSEIVTPENSREYQRGMTGHSVIIDGDFLGVTMTVTDSEAIDAIVSGKARELSCGYRATVAHRGDSGKYEQLSRNYNHVAIVERGRAGPNVRVMLDSADTNEDSIECWIADSGQIADDSSGVSNPVTPNNSNLRGSKPRRDMASRQFTINNEIITVEEGIAADAIASLLCQIKEMKGDEKEDSAKLSSMGYSGYWDAIDGLKSKLDAAESTLSETKTKLDAAEGKAAGLELQLNDRADSATAEVKTDAADIEQIRADAEAKISGEVKARLDAWAEVTPRLPKDFTIDHSLDVSGIYRAYLSAVHPQLSLDGKDAAYIEGVYQGLSIGVANKADAARNEIHNARANVAVNASHKFDANKSSTMSAARSKPLPGVSAKGDK